MPSLIQYLHIHICVFRTFSVSLTQQRETKLTNYFTSLAKKVPGFLRMPASAKQAAAILKETKTFFPSKKVNRHAIIGH